MGTPTKVGCLTPAEILLGMCNINILIIPHTNNQLKGTWCKRKDYGIYIFYFNFSRTTNQCILNREKIIEVQNYK